MREDKIKESVIDFVLKYNGIETEYKSLDFKIVLFKYLYMFKYDHKKALPNLLRLIKYDDKLEKTNRINKKYITSLEDYIKELEKVNDTYSRKLNKFATKFNWLTILFLINLITVIISIICNNILE